MKIYFDGCSYTEGIGYLGEDYLDKRWSKLLCTKLGAEEYNISESGGSNQRILRNISTTHYNDTYDIAIIQLTFPSRTEFYNGERFKSINSHIVRRGDGSYFILQADARGLKKHNGSSSAYWKIYYERIYDDMYGETMEQMVYNSVKSIFKEKNTKLILLSCYENTKLNYDITITPQTYPVVGNVNGKFNHHPSVDAQKLIANDIYNLL